MFLNSKNNINMTEVNESLSGITHMANNTPHAEPIEATEAEVTAVSEFLMTKHPRVYEELAK